MTWKTWRLRGLIDADRIVGVDWVDCPMSDPDISHRWNAVPHGEACATLLASGWMAAVIPHLVVVDQLRHADRMEVIE